MIISLFGLILLASTSERYADTRLAVLRERVQLLETRLSEDISILRQEFNSEINNLPNHHDVVSATNDEEATHGNANEEYLEMFERTTHQLFSQIAVLQAGFRKDKVFRRDLQHKLQTEQLNTTDIVTTLSSIGFNITNKIDEMKLQKLNTQLDAIKKILEEVIVVKDKTDESQANDCSEWLRRDYTTSGIYEIYPNTMWRPLEVYCDMTTEGGGWTVFQRRCDGSEDFYRTWNDYRFGFGNLSSEFWLGNEYLYRVMQRAPQEMRIELEDFENDRRHAKYALFEIKSAADLFKLHVEDFSGNVSDSLIDTHNNMQFSTRDKGPSSTCSKQYKGGFWYKNCHSVNVNGKYLKGEHKSYADGVNWYAFRGYHYSLKFTEMKFRPK